MLRQTGCVSDRASEDNVAALDVSLYIDAAGLLQHQLELLHRQYVAAADIDAAKQSDVCDCPVVYIHEQTLSWILVTVLAVLILAKGTHVLSGLHQLRGTPVLLSRAR